MRVRIGLAAGEPVTESDDLFGAAVQLAARLCSRAEPGTILVSSAVHDLAMGKGFTFRKRGRLRLKGFDEPLAVFEVAWADAATAHDWLGPLVDDVPSRDEVPSLHIALALDGDGAAVLAVELVLEELVGGAGDLDAVGRALGLHAATPC